MTNVILNNSARNSDTEEIRKIKHSGMTIDLTVFSQGEIIYSKKEYASLSMDESIHLKHNDFDSLFNTTSQEFTLVFNCYFKKSELFIPQEHQVLYSTSNKKYATILYDQFPNIVNLPKINPIVLLAPKIWLSTTINTYILITSINENNLDPSQRYPFKIHILNEEGNIILTCNIDAYNRSVLLDIKALLSKKVSIDEKISFFTLVAKGGGNGATVISTLIQNLETNSLALEHSLNPGYYSSGNRTKIRKDALNFENYKDKA